MKQPKPIQSSARKLELRKQRIRELERRELDTVAGGQRMLPTAHCPTTDAI
jgi:hypothetical protein